MNTKMRSPDEVLMSVWRSMMRLAVISPTTRSSSGLAFSIKGRAHFLHELAAVGGLSELLLGGS